MPGITRIQIDSDWDDEQTKMSKDLAPASDRLLRPIFQALSLPLRPGVETVRCTKGEAIARYDHTEGIDVILRFLHGGKGTLQEKFLTFHESTATFETKRGGGGEGMWDYCTAQYYFVGYARRYKTEHLLEFQDWILLDLPALHRADGRENLPWHFNRNMNKKLRRKAPFKYLYFDDIPEDCVLLSPASLKLGSAGDLTKSDIQNHQLSYLEAPITPLVATSTAASPKADREFERLRVNWRHVIRQAPEDTKRTPVIGILASAGIKPVAVEGDTVVLAFRYPLHKVKIGMPENGQVAERIIGHFLGHPCHVRCIYEPEDDHLVQEALKIGAQIIDVEGERPI